MNRSVRRRITKLVKKAKAKGIILRKNDPITKTLQNLWRDLDNNFEAPQEFQRPLSWKSDNKIKYFNSILMNRIEGTIVIVNVVKALAALKRAAGSIQNDAYANYHKAIRLFEDSSVKSLNLISDRGPIEADDVSTSFPGESIVSSSILALVLGSEPKPNS